VTKMGEACQPVSNHFLSIAPVRELLAEHRPSGPWYALKVRNGGEASVVEALESRGLKPYCPTQKERRRYSDRMRIVDKPIFPGYVFCPFDVQKKLPIVSCPGVDYIVGFAGVPTAIPQVQMEGIRRMVEAGAMASERFAAGDRVRVMRGPLEGIEGVLVREPRGSRLVVSIELLNRAASLYIDQEQTSIVGSAR
jgi:transcription antitermination factor NusG